jgi:outer membrane receptor protein involved in Fe transport
LHVPFYVDRRPSLLQLRLAKHRPIPVPDGVGYPDDDEPHQRFVPATDSCIGPNSGLRSGFANTDYLPFYTQVNFGVSHEFQWSDAKPTTLRFDVINVFDTIHEIRDGSGIGVFAPQFGPRRAYYLGLAQKF